MPIPLSAIADVGRSMVPGRSRSATAGSSSSHTKSAKGAAASASPSGAQSQLHGVRPGPSTYVSNASSASWAATKPQCPRITTELNSAHSGIPPSETSFSLRDALVHNFELALRRQGSLSSSGKMSIPGPSRTYVPSLPERREVSPVWETDGHCGEQFAQSRLPPTPPFYASPTTSSSYSIPTTPPPEYSPSPMSRSRSGSLASSRNFVTSPALQNNPVMLPIGQKVPKWREAWEIEAGAKPDYWPVARSTRRFSRAPAGPRPMARSAPSADAYIGLGFGLPTESEQARVLRERRKGLVGSQFGWQDDQFAAIREMAPEVFGVEFDDTMGREGHGSGVGGGQSEDGEEADSADSHSAYARDDGDDHKSFGCFSDIASSCQLEDNAPQANVAVRTTSPLSIPARHPDYHVGHASPISLPTLTVLIPNSPPSSSRTPRRQTRVPAEAEKSAFDSDSEGDSDERPAMLKRAQSFTRLGSGFGRLRRALSSSRSSSPATKGRVRPGISEQPSENARRISAASSISALSLSSSMLARPPTRLKCLSPIPATPLELNPPEDNDYDNVTQLDSPCSIPTPVTPDVERTKSFLWTLTTPFPLPSSMPPPVPPLPPCALSVAQGPPDLPLPLTPQPVPVQISSADEQRLQQEQSVDVDHWRTSNSDDRMSTVDPDISMARLEMSIAKLEAYAPPLQQDSSGWLSQESSRRDASVIMEDEEEDEVGDSVSVAPESESSFQCPLVPPNGSSSKALGLSSSFSRYSREFSVLMASKPPTVPPKDFPYANQSPGSANIKVRQQSQGLLPKFEFESLDWTLELEGYPLSSESRLRYIRKKREEHASRSTAVSPIERSWSALSTRESKRAYHQHQPSSTTPPPPVRARQRARASSSPSVPKPPVSPLPPRPPTHDRPPTANSVSSKVSSFMSDSPDGTMEKEKGQRSRVRELLGRVQVRTEFVKGLRESFNVPPSHIP